MYEMEIEVKLSWGKGDWANRSHEEKEKERRKNKINV